MTFSHFRSTTAKQRDKIVPARCMYAWFLHLAATMETQLWEALYARAHFLWVLRLVNEPAKPLKTVGLIETILTEVALCYGCGRNDVDTMNGAISGILGAEPTWRSITLQDIC